MKEGNGRLKLENNYSFHNKSYIRSFSQKKYPNLQRLKILSETDKTFFFKFQNCLFVNLGKSSVVLYFKSKLIA